MQPTTYRGLQWLAFAEEVLEHIEAYTVPQYGDMPDDPVSSWTPRRCLDEIERYVSRFGSGQRGPEEEQRDLLKIAHYSCLALGLIHSGRTEDHEAQNALPASICEETDARDQDHA